MMNHRPPRFLDRQPRLRRPHASVGAASSSPAASIAPLSTAAAIALPSTTSSIVPLSTDAAIALPSTTSSIVPLPIASLSTASSIAHLSTSAASSIASLSSAAATGGPELPEDFEDFVAKYEDDCDDFRRKREQLDDEREELEGRKNCAKKYFERMVREKVFEMASMFLEQSFDLKITEEDKRKEIANLTEEMNSALEQMRTEHEEENAGYRQELAQIEARLARVSVDLVPENSALLRELECPVCYNPMLPPVKIYQCRKGHYVCSTCKHNEHCSPHCPLCRDNFVLYPPTRCILAEKIAAKLAK